MVPDIVTLAKSLGGGKTAIGAMIARRALYMKAYGTPKTALIAHRAIRCMGGFVGNHTTFPPYAFAL